MTALGFASLLVACDPPGAVPNAVVRPSLPVQMTAHADFRGEFASADVRALADHVVATGDHGQQAFAIVDKTDARVYLFEGSGVLAGASPALLGLAAGDDSVPGIGDRPLAAVRAEERTTPAGRFVAQPGHNLDGNPVVWVDYDAAVSLHSIRSVSASERREERMRSADASRHRISYGCINVPIDFFDRLARPAFSVPGGIIYVMPETRPWQTLFVGASAVR